MCPQNRSIIAIMIKLFTTTANAATTGRLPAAMPVTAENRSRHSANRPDATDLFAVFGEGVLHELFDGWDVADSAGRVPCAVEIAPQTGRASPT